MTDHFANSKLEEEPVHGATQMTRHFVNSKPVEEPVHGAIQLMCTPTIASASYSGTGANSWCNTKNRPFTTSIPEQQPIQTTNSDFTNNKFGPEMHVYAIRFVGTYRVPYFYASGASNPPFFVLLTNYVTHMLLRTAWYPGSFVTDNSYT